MLTSVGRRMICGWSPITITQVSWNSVQRAVYCTTHTDCKYFHSDNYVYPKLQYGTTFAANEYTYVYFALSLKKSSKKTLTCLASGLFLGSWFQLCVITSSHSLGGLLRKFVAGLSPLLTSSARSVGLFPLFASISDIWSAASTPYHISQSSIPRLKMSAFRLYICCCLCTSGAMYTGDPTKVPAMSCCSFVMPTSASFTTFSLLICVQKEEKLIC